MPAAKKKKQAAGSRQRAAKKKQSKKPTSAGARPPPLSIDGLVAKAKTDPGSLTVAELRQLKQLQKMRAVAPDAASAYEVHRDAMAGRSRSMSKAGRDVGPLPEVVHPRRWLFVIDGSKALRSAIDAVYGANNPVQRCRSHKVRNVMGHLPDELKDSVKAVMKAAYRLDAKEGMARLKKQADWLETEYPSAATSLLEGLEETFTVNTLGIPPALRRCLCTINLIENPNASVRRGTRRVSRWKDGKMAMRWAASTFLDVEKRFRRILGYRDLWTLKAILDEKCIDEEKEAA